MNKILQSQIDLLDDLVISIEENRLTEIYQVLALIKDTANILEEHKNSTIEACVSCGEPFFMVQLDDDMNCSSCANKFDNREEY